MTSLRRAESSAVALLAAIAPWLAPLAPAWFAWVGMTTRLNVWQPVAAAVAVAIEALGIATAYTALELYQHNRRYKSERNKAPTKLAAGVYVFYLMVILSINVVMEISYNGVTRIVAIALLSLLSVPASGLLAIRANYAALQAEIRDMRRIRSETKADAPKPVKYRCGVCGETFRSSSVKANHVRWKHRNGVKA